MRISNIILIFIKNMEYVIKSQITNNNNLIDLLKIFNKNLHTIDTIDYNNIDKLRLINNNYEIVQSNIYSILNNLEDAEINDPILINSLQLEKQTNKNLTKILPVMLQLFMLLPDSHWSS